MVTEEEVLFESVSGRLLLLPTVTALPKFRLALERVRLLLSVVDVEGESAWQPASSSRQAKAKVEAKIEAVPQRYTRLPFKQCPLRKPHLPRAAGDFGHRRLPPSAG